MRKCEFDAFLWSWCGVTILIPPPKNLWKYQFWNIWQLSRPAVFSISIFTPPYCPFLWCTNNCFHLVCCNHTTIPYLSWDSVISSIVCAFFWQFNTFEKRKNTVEYIYPYIDLFTNWSVQNWLRSYFYAIQVHILIYKISPFQVFC